LPSLALNHYLIISASQVVRITDVSHCTCHESPTFLALQREFSKMDLIPPLALPPCPPFPSSSTELYSLHMLNSLLFPNCTILPPTQGLLTQVPQTPWGQEDAYRWNSELAWKKIIYLFSLASLESTTSSNYYYSQQTTVGPSGLAILSLIEIISVFLSHDRWKESQCVIYSHQCWELSSSY
jgi:hypothetical protein